MRTKTIFAESHKDPTYREAYDALGDVVAVAAQAIEARTRAGLTQAELAERIGTC